MFAFPDSKLRGWPRSSVLLVLILSLAIFLRVYQFPDNPPGFYADEAGVSYEAFSLLKTGADRWGVHLPVYFISWGSGQSVLYAYLSIPLIASLGLTIFASRLLNLFFGFLTVPLVYATIKRVSGKHAALIAAFVLAILPWHVMISRWALDANLLPFFLLLGIYTVTRALDQADARWTWLALVSWGLALYAYAMAYIMVPILLLLIVLVYRKTIKQSWRAWLGAFMVFALLALPIALFVIKNFVVHADLPFEKFLPFGLPLLPISRIAQVSSHPLIERWVNSFFITLAGFQDGEIRNSIPGIAPMFLICLPLAVVGAANQLRQYRRTGKVNLFLLWLIACLPLLFLWDLAVNRINAIFIPMLVVAVDGFFYLVGKLAIVPRRILAIGVALLIAIEAGVFVHDYFLVYPRLPDAELAFYRGFERAFNKGLSIAAPADNILVTDRILLPYFLVAFYSNYPPVQYPSDLQSTLENGAINVQSLGRFYFGAYNLPDDQRAFVYVLAKWDAVPCIDAQVALETRLWQVGQCPNR